MRKPYVEVGLFATLHATVVTVLLLLFLWPAGAATPNNVPVGLVGQGPQVEQIAKMLDEGQSGALEITVYQDRDQATDAIALKEIYGAIVVAEKPEVLIATASSPAVAQLITQLGNQILIQSASMQGIQIPRLATTDLAPLSESDPRGAVFGSATLPMVIGGISLGAIAMLRFKRWDSKLAFVSIASVGTGLLSAAVIATVFDALPGDYWLNALAMIAILAAIGVALVGAEAVAGSAGFGLTAATLFLVGNPLNGVSLPIEFYPGFWGQVGQLMPVGSGFELLKRVNYFPEAEMQNQWWVLATWILVGLGLSMLRTKVKEV
jgi:hypothetical protein